MRHTPASASTSASALTLTLALALCAAGCADSHRAAIEDTAQQSALDVDGPVDAAEPPSEPAPYQYPYSYPYPYPTTAPSACAAPEAGLPELLGLGDREVWLQALGAEPVLVHQFDADDPALDDPQGRLTPTQAGEHVLVTAGAAFTTLGIGPQSRVLFTRRGELLWAKSWGDREGGEHRDLSKDGALLLESDGRHTVVTADGTERVLPRGFVPFRAPDANGWMGGVFVDGDAVLGYGFQHFETDARRPLARESRGALEVGRPELVDGRFYYAFIDAQGQAHIAIEAPTGETVLALDGQTNLPELQPGATHTIVHRQGRPIALLDRARTKLTPVDATALSDEPLYMVMDGDWVVGLSPGEVQWQFDATGNLRTKLAERRYRLHVPSARIDTEPLPELPEGMRIYDDPSCNPGTRGHSRDGRMVVQLAPTDAADPAPGRFFVERDPDLQPDASSDAADWEPLGEAVFFAEGGDAQEVDGRWLLSTSDIRNTYCAVAGRGAGVELPEDALAGYTAQIVSGDETLLAVDTTEVSLTLSADGRCALAVADGETTLHDFVNDRTHAIDLPDPRLLYAFTPYQPSW